MKSRHLKGKPYTRTGDIVIAVNPYQWYHDLYTTEKRHLYSQRLVWDDSASAMETIRASLQPHVYEVSALAYRGLTNQMGNQSILVSGESGAGKTETVKICLSHIASIQYGNRYLQSTDSDPVVQRVVESNPLLEAFGNAKTRRNDNSSRFGKYLQLQFQHDDKPENEYSNMKSGKLCTLVGSVCDVYLLEKTRVIQHDPEERNFHIFYQLLAAPEDQKVKYWEGLRDTSNESFRYVGATSANMIEGVYDAVRFQDTLNALSLVGIEEAKLKMLIQALCIILQLGNLNFKTAHDGDSDKSTISTLKELEALSTLMNVSLHDLSVSFTERTFTTGKETHKVPLNPESAKDACDALAKESYQKVFLWLVNSINEATQADRSSSQRYGTIGLLDIFGFEIFPQNRFEQLCINFANEKLQQKFNQDIFKNVQSEYAAEGISLSEIAYDDNTDVLDLIEGKTGLLNLLNEECIRPKGNDMDFVHKALRMNQTSPALKVHKTDRLSFGIQHYAGLVMYDADTFVAKNLDTLPTDLHACCERSSNGIINSPRIGNEESLYRKRRTNNIMAPTVWTKYKNQLSSLMDNLGETTSRYIRCIKPNSNKAPLQLEHKTTVEQLRCAGVVAGITIARSAFPNRLANTSVLARYSNLLDESKYPSSKKSSMSMTEKRQCDCKALLESALKTRSFVDANGKVVNAFLVGKTKTFFRSGALEFLESGRMTGLDTKAVVIQCAIRKWLSRLAKTYEARRQKELLSRQEAEKRRQDERLQREDDERRASHQLEIQKMKDQINQLQKMCYKFSRQQDRKVQAALDRNEQSRKQLDELKLSCAKDTEEQIKLRQVVVISQDKSLEENEKMIKYLKRENIRARKERSRIQSKLDETKSMAKKINGAHNEIVGAIDKTALAIIHDGNIHELVRDAKCESKKLSAEVAKMQCKYLEEAKKRLQLQKSTARIITAVQSCVTNRNIVEESVITALQAESYSKCVMAGLDIATLEADLTGSEISDSSGSDYLDFC